MTVRPRNETGTRGRRRSRRTGVAINRLDICAYLLDRADQYDTESPCWVAITDAVSNVLAGEVEQARRSGELTRDLYARLQTMGGSRAVDPQLGVDDE